MALPLLSRRFLIFNFYRFGRCGSVLDLGVRLSSTVQIFVFVCDALQHIHVYKYMFSKEYTK